MNAQKHISIMKSKAVFQNIVAALLGAGALLVAGCGGEDAGTASAPPVRGEPIQVAEVRGEPIEAPVEQPAEKESPAETKTREETESTENAAASAEAAAESLVNKTMEMVKATVAPAETAVASVAAEGAAKAPAETDNAPAPKAETAAAPVEGPALPPMPESAPKTEAAETTVAAKPAETEAAKPKPATVAKPEVVKSGGQEYAQVTFDQLASFEYEMPDEFSEVDAPSDDASQEAEPNEGAEPPAAKTKEDKDQIPANVRKFNNTRVALEGFMLPLKVEDSLVTEMLIMRDQSMCCFGSVPKINEWVSIRMTGKGVKPVMDEPVTIYGKLKVGEIRENGYLVGIYEMDGDRMGARIDF
jgi:hypothetical protein